MSHEFSMRDLLLYMIRIVYDLTTMMDEPTV